MFSIGYEAIDLEDAVLVLGLFKYEQYDNWYVRDGRAEPKAVVADISLDAFSAIAIAEKYLRDHAITFRVLSSESTHSDSTATVSAVWHIKVSN